jgi:hypothetical protein
LCYEDSSLPSGRSFEGLNIDDDDVNTDLWMYGSMSLSSMLETVKVWKIKIRQ